MNSNNLVLIVKRVMLSTALAAGLLCTLSAEASPPADETPAITVKYADLDLSTTTGAHRLYRRIVVAAQRVCPSDVTMDLHRLAIVQACRADAIARAVQAVNSPKLAAVHEHSANHG